MTAIARNTAIVVAGYLIAACTQVGHIQQAEPIRTLNFHGSHKALAMCVQSRLGGKVREEFGGTRYIIYDSVKAEAASGLTHYSNTVSSFGDERGFAEWRVIRTGREPGPAGRPPPPLTLDALRQYWVPVEQCAAMLKPPA
jgi:hypothetical protein